MDAFEVEMLDADVGHCDCCGRDTHTVWGWIHAGHATMAAYWVRWTDGHFDELGADFDLVIGAWGDGTTARERSAISALYRAPPENGFMVIDAKPQRDLAAHELTRQEVIGTPMASQVFALLDAIWLQDGRLFGADASQET